MIDYIIKSTISLAVLLAFYHLLLEREKMYRFNRYYLICSLLLSLSLPLITIPAYVEIEEPVKTARDNVIESLTDKPQFPAEVHPQNADYALSKTLNWEYVAIGLYFFVTAVTALRFLYNFIHFFIVKKRNPVSQYRGATIVLLDHIPIPYTFLDNIYINRHDYEQSVIEPELLTHELAHVGQRHTLDILFVEILKIVLWFNPLLYLYKRAIQINHEFLADDAVIKNHQNITSYRELLLTKASEPVSHGLSSSINFSLTKKRFDMMTKTTTRSKSIALKASSLPVAALLIFTISFKTVVVAKENTSRPVMEISSPVNNITTLSPVAEEIIEDEAPNTEIEITVSDTIKGDARRDEYFRGVRIIIDDKLNKLNIDKPYEKLTIEQKRYYLADVPGKQKPKGVSPEDYEFSLGRKNVIFYLDDKKVSKDEILKYKREDFAKSSFKMSGESNPDGERKEIFQTFFYTYDHFNKYIKNINDHYTDSLYKIVIEDKATDYSAALEQKRKEQKNNDGKSDLERSREKLEKEINAPTYPRTDEFKERGSRISFQFPGGIDKFNSYLKKAIVQNTKERRTDLRISFSVNTDGSLSEIDIRDENNEEVKKAITKALENAPRWIPSQLDGHPVKTGTSMKITF